MKVEIYISPKKSVLDPQGQAVEEALARQGFESAKNCRVGKTVSLDIPDMSQQDAQDHIAKMCDAILVNPIVETYTYRIVETA